MNTRTETYFLEIAKQRSISKAAERLFVSQSTLSQFLLNLEKEVGTNLFERGKQELVLTSAGAKYLAGAAEILRIKEQVYESIQENRKEGRRKWKVGITSRESLNMFLEGAKRFQELEPDIVFDIVEGNVKPIMKMLEEGELHMAILVLSKESEVKDNWELLKAEEVFLAIPKDELCKAGNELQGFANSKVILAKKGTAFREFEEEILQLAHIDPQIAFEINNIEAVKELVSSGLGFSFIPASMVEKEDAISYQALNPPTFRYHVLGLGKVLVHKKPLECWITILKDIGSDKNS